MSSSSSSQLVAASGPPPEFQRLSPQQEADILPLAQQANQWLSALVALLGEASCHAGGPGAAGVDAILKTLDATMRYAASNNATITFQHFAWDCRQSTYVMTDPGRIEDFVVHVVPRIHLFRHIQLNIGRWRSFRDEDRHKLQTVVAQLGRMVESLLTYLRDDDDEARSQAGGSASGSAGGGVDPELRKMILAALPAGIVAQLEAQGGDALDNVIKNALAAAQPQGQATGQDALPDGPMGGIMALMQKFGIGGAMGGIAGLTSLLGAVGPLMQKFKQSVGELSEKPTAEDKRAYYKNIAAFVSREIHDAKSVISKFADLFEQSYPDGLSPQAIAQLIDRSRGFLIISGAKQSDTAWVIIRLIKGYHAEMQKMTKKTPMLTRETLANKLITFVQVALDSEGAVETLVDAATNSEVIKSIAGKFMNVPVSEIAKNPFGSGGGRGGGSGKRIAAGEEGEEESWSDPADE